MTPNIMKGDKSAMGLPKDRYDDPNHPTNKPSMQPDSMKDSTDSTDPTDTSTSSTGSAGQGILSSVTGGGSKMDGDHSAKAFDAGANSATNVTDLTDGIHEGAHQGSAQGDKETGQGTSIFSKDGAIGSAFTGDGILGSLGNQAGGPFASSGTVGKEFEAHGKVGGTFQELAKKNEDH